MADAPGTRLIRPTRRWLDRPSWVVAPELLGAELVVTGEDGPTGGVIVEVEAYGGPATGGPDDDPASHAFRGRRVANGTMFDAAGGLYVYFTYGMHHCANVVTGDGTAVLLRALAPTAGIGAMHERRTRPGAKRALRDHDLASGPGKLCQALAIDRTLDGIDLLDPSGPVQLRRRTPVLPVDGIVCTTRVGLSVAIDRPWRWYRAGDPNVSRPR